jgi:phosphinothricin acetyltransferase
VHAEVDITHLHRNHWEDVRRIFLEGVATGNATFETEAPSWEEWDRRHLAPCRLVALASGRACGWVALSPVSSRSVYSGVAEVSVYVGAAFRGRGVGHRLLAEAIDASERNGIWTLQAGIFPENEASMGLHQGLGFRVVGVRERIGRMGSVWRDVVLLERRSRVAAVG